MQAAKKRSVVDVSPGQYAVEVWPERQLTDTHANLVVTDGIPRPVFEIQVAEVGVSIEAAKICLAKVHQNALRPGEISRVLEVIRLPDRIGVRIIPIDSGDNQLHPSSP